MRVAVAMVIVFVERTYRKAPQKPPSSVKLYGVNPTTVRVIWRYVQPSLEEEPLQGYKVYISVIILHLNQLKNISILHKILIDFILYENLVSGV